MRQLIEQLQAENEELRKRLEPPKKAPVRKAVKKSAG